MMMKMKPLYLWAGGKSKMWKHYEPYLPGTISTYVEPFFGGGAMLCGLINAGYNPEKIVINDINSDIINIYYAIKNDVDYFLILMNGFDAEYIPLNKEDRKDYYYKIRHQHGWDSDNWDATKRAAYLYFLMRTGFNGIWQINQNTNGKYGTPAGLLNQKDSVYDYNNVMLWHRLLQRADLLCEDWSTCTSSILDDTNTFVFLDPPYRNCYADYDNPMDDSVHKSMLSFVIGFKQASVWYCNQDSGDGFFDDYSPLKWEYTYTAGRRKRTENGFEAKKAVEILVRNK
jgi:DNA adenine methylase